MEAEEEESVVSMGTMLRKPSPHEMSRAQKQFGVLLWVLCPICIPEIAYSDQGPPSHTISTSDCKIFLSLTYTQMKKKRSNMASFLQQLILFFHETLEDVRSTRHVAAR